MSVKAVPITILGLLTFFNIGLYLYHTSSRVTKNGFSCSFNNFMTAFSQYLHENGRKSLVETLPQICENHVPSKENIDLFREVFKEIVYECSLQPPVSIEMEIKRPIATLFTTLHSTPKKYFVHNTTVRNWSTFLPKVNLAVFTNDSKVRRECESRGWTVFPITKHAAGGVPVLKTMFTTVMQKFDTRYYGYSNADILFTDTLLKTLVTASKHFSAETTVMITGRRFNIPMLTLKEAVSYDTIMSTVKKRGEVFVTSSEDFFITSKQFKWDVIPELVVGRPAFDNWVVAHARCSGAAVVDATDAVLAAHQTTKAGNSEGWANNFTTYNNDKLKEHKINLAYDKGFTTCPEYHTITNLCGNLEIMKRKELPKYCKC